MLALRVEVFADGKFPELADKLVPAADGVMTITTLEGGMASGLPSVGFLIPLEDGRVVFAQTSMRLFIAAAQAIVAAHGDPR